MKIDVLVAEIGSTTTVVNAFDGIYDGDPRFVGQGQATTTVYEGGDVTVGVNNAIKDLKQSLEVDELDYSELFATSSAAGGLKMTVHGLVFDMTARAAKEAALGAGAVIRMVTAGKLRRTDLKKIQEINPNIILIAGGVDYGERDTALENAEKIVDLELPIPVIYAGNIENQEEIKLIFEDSDEDLYVVENVYPQIDDLNIEPTRRVIHDAFEKHIIHAAGMEHIFDIVTGNIAPTPGAVMSMTKLIADRLGDVLVVDVGGATSDVHSVTDGNAAIAEIAVAAEPRAKRTVEGDIGLYVNLDHVLELFEEDELENKGYNVEEILKDYDGIPKTKEERELIVLLAEKATVTAAKRHAGRLRYVYGPSGRATLSQGKDLTKVEYIIGTGGALSQLEEGKDILEEIIVKDDQSMLLLPQGDDVKVLIDHDYIMASLGILSYKYPDEALQLLANSLRIE